MPSIEVDIETARVLELVARLTGSTPGEVVGRLVRQERLRLPALSAHEAVPTLEAEESVEGVPVHANYAGQRVNAVFDPLRQRVVFEDGPLVGRVYDSPSGAARALVAWLNPRVDPNRNGWTFWTVSATGGLLRTLR